MKTLFLTAALTLASFACFAQESEQAKAKTEETTQDNFKEIKVDETPEQITKALTKAYPAAKLQKVYMNDNKDYKLQIIVDNKEGLLYADQNGNWIQK